MEKIMSAEEFDNITPGNRWEIMKKYAEYYHAQHSKTLTDEQIGELFDKNADDGVKVKSADNWTAISAMTKEKFISVIKSLNVSDNKAIAFGEWCKLNAINEDFIAEHNHSVSELYAIFDKDYTPAEIDWEQLKIDFKMSAICKRSESNAVVEWFKEKLKKQND